MCKDYPQQRILKMGKKKNKMTASVNLNMTHNSETFKIRHYMTNQKTKIMIWALKLV